MASILRDLQRRHSFDLLQILAVYAPVMFAFALVTHSGSLHGDMTEAWAWGKEFQLGYPKHPMIFGWIAGAWFQLMPRTDWSFYLLSIINAAIGLAGVWMLAGMFLDVRGRAVAVLFLALTPSYTVWALKFNANSILLSSWPWTTYFFLQSLQKRTVGFGLLAGAAGAIAVLSKYYSLILVATLLFAAVLHPERRQYFRSSVPYVTVAVGLALLAPHAWWLIDKDFPPLRYAIEKTEYPVALARSQAIGAVVEGYLCLGLGAVAFALAFGGQIWVLLKRALGATLQPGTAWLIWLAHGPVLLTIAAYLVSNVRFTVSYLIPVFFAMPVAFLAASGTVVTAPVLRRVALAAVGAWLPLIVASPVLALYSFEHAAPGDVEPRRELAIAATQIWHRLFDRPLKFVAGTGALATAATFYSPDAPSYLILGNPSLSPWARPKQVKRDGVVILCRSSDQACIKRAEGMLGEWPLRTTRTFATSFMGRQSSPQSFVLFVLPPAGMNFLD
jgi:4-amino-4-deoxy-L-arabinose transferase-like glycosyltransferase